MILLSFAKIIKFPGDRLDVSRSTKRPVLPSVFHVHREHHTFHLNFSKSKINDLWFESDK